MTTQKTLGQIAKDAFEQQVTESMFLHEGGCHNLTVSPPQSKPKSLRGRLL